MAKIFTWRHASHQGKPWMDPRQGRRRTEELVHTFRDSCTAIELTALVTINYISLTWLLFFSSASWRFTSSYLLQRFEWDRHFANGNVSLLRWRWRKNRYMNSWVDGGLWNYEWKEEAVFYCFSSCCKLAAPSPLKCVIRTGLLVCFYFILNRP